MEVGSGFAAFGTGLLTPYADTVLADGSDHTYCLGTRLHMGRQGATGLTLEAQRQESAATQPVNQGLQLQIGWDF